MRPSESNKAATHRGSESSSSLQPTKPLGGLELQAQQNLALTRSLERSVECWSIGGILSSLLRRVTSHLLSSTRLAASTAIRSHRSWTQSRRMVCYSRSAAGLQRIG